MKDFFIILIMKILNLILKIFGKHGGNFLGKIAYDWDSNIFKYFKVNCPVIAVTATNGKTMTNNAIGYTLKTAGKKVISNTEGNNMETGILSTILKNCTLIYLWWTNVGQMSAVCPGRGKSLVLEPRRPLSLGLGRGLAD